MSLINQMLQDLDKRSADGASGALLHQQIRTVPKQTKDRRLQLIALFLILVLAGVGVWRWLHTSVAVVPVAQPEAPVLPLTMKSEAVLSTSPVESVPNQILSVPAMAKAKPVKSSSVVKPAESEATASVNEVVKASTPDQAPERTAKPVVVVPVNTSPSSVNKQMKELTPQQRADSDYRKSVTWIQQGRIIEAIAGLEQAIQADPTHASARQTLVGVLIEGKRQDEALHKLQDGLNLDPGQTGMAMLLARLQLEKGDVHSGTETLQRTLPYALERADYQSFLAALLQREGKHKEAIEHYLAALRKSPQSGVWWMGAGISLQAENRTTDALEAFNRAKATNSLTPELQVFVEQKLKQLQR